MSFKLQKATPENAPIFAAFIGGAGEGKTLSALLFARGLAGPDGRIAMIDTEGRRSLHYADDQEVGGFEFVEFAAPFSSDRYREALKTCVEGGAHVIIIDSASHEWFAEGGVLDFADQEEKRLANHRGKAIAKWARPKMAHRNFLACAMGLPAHVIFCYREDVVTDSDGNEQVKTNAGKKDKFEMLFSVRLENQGRVAGFDKALPRGMEHLLKVGEQISVETGERFAEPHASQDRPAADDYAELRTKVTSWAWEHGIDDDAITDELKRRGAEIESWTQATPEMLRFVIDKGDKFASKLTTKTNLAAASPSPVPSSATGGESSPSDKQP